MLVDALERFFALEEHLLERLSTRTEPFEYGVAYFDEEYRERYNSNFLYAMRPLDGAPAEVLFEAADRVLGGAGFAHREVLVRDDRDGERVAPAFVDHRYAVERNAILVSRRAPDREPDLAVEEVPFAEVKPLIHEIYRREAKLPPETVTLFTDQHGKNERAIGARFFVVRFDRRLAGDCELYVDGRDAQVEYVDTLEEFRGRGVARAVVLRAITAAEEAGAERVFIVADDDDWPKDLYVRLGFDRIGRTWQFILAPKGDHQ